MNDTRADDQLVAAHLAGDRSALAGIYDRYADSLYDTAAAMLSDRHEAADVMQDVILIAAQRLDQLRDPARLKPWLFAILRNQVFTRSKRRGRTRPVDFAAPEAPEMAAPIDPDAEGESVAYAQLAELVRSAAAGLDDRDQLVLEYSLRQDLSGADLADALGVSLEQSYVVVSRMRDRVERTLGALTVARMGRKDCPDLATVLAGWDGTFSVLIRKRVARHIDGCDVCDRTKRKYAVIPLLGAAPALAAPGDLRERVLERAGRGTTPDVGYGFDADGGFPRSARRRRSRFAIAAAIIAAALVLLTGGLAIGIGSEPGDQVTVASPGSPFTADDGGDGGGDGSEPAETVPAAAAPSDTEPAASETVDTGSPTTSGVVTESTVAPETSILASSTTVAVDPGPIATLPVPTALPVPPPPVVAPAPTPTTAPAPTSTTTPLAPGQLDVSSSLLDFGGALTNAQLTLSNSGQQPVAWALNGVAAPFSSSATGGELAPGQAVGLQFALDRGSAAEGSLDRVVTVVSSAGGGGAVQLRATIDRAPQVTIVQGAPNPTCPPIQVPTIVASVSDESPLTSVRLSWSGSGSPGNVAMQFGGNWSGPLGVDYVEGTWTYVVTATDARGNTATASGSTQVLCPTPG